MQISVSIFLRLLNILTKVFILPSKGTSWSVPSSPFLLDTFETLKNFYCSFFLTLWNVQCFLDHLEGFSSAELFLLRATKSIRSGCEIRSWQEPRILPPLKESCTRPLTGHRAYCKSLVTPSYPALGPPLTKWAFIEWASTEWAFIRPGSNTFMLYWACLVCWNLWNTLKKATPAFWSFWLAQLHQAKSIKHKKVLESKTITHLILVWS